MHLLLGGVFNESINLMMYNNWALHSFPVAVNTYTNILLKSVSQSNASIITQIHPILEGEDKQVIDVT